MNQKKQNSSRTFNLPDLLWDMWCVFSVIGIWPRFIEPNLLTTTKLSLPIPNLPEKLKNLRILQFSDLHLHPRVTNFFLNSLIKKIQKLQPDIIVFTGDFLCYSMLSDKDRLKKIFNSLSAPYGCYSILGNHDYQNSVSVNEQGDYDVVQNKSSIIGKGFQRLFSSPSLSKKITPAAKSVKQHRELISLLKETPFQLLHNQTVSIPIEDVTLNLCGVGEYMLGRCNPEKAFEKYDHRFPGIILAHNPDCVPTLKRYPFDDFHRIV